MDRQVDWSNKINNNKNDNKNDIAGVDLKVIYSKYLYTGWYVIS